MADIAMNLLRRVFAWFMALISVFSLKGGQNTPAPETGKPYLFSSEQAYENYYLYCTEEDPEPYAWSPEALAARANVVKETESGGFSVTLFKNGTARVNHMTRPAETAEIPASVDGYTVTAVYSVLPYGAYDAAARIASAVKKAVIPDTVEYVMERAFEDLSNLREVRFGARVRFMGANAFRGCTLLSAAVLPDSLLALPVSAFESSAALTSVVFGKNVRRIGVCAFFDCPNLRRVTLPGGVTSLDTQCFALCKRLSYIYIPASVTAIEDDAFGRCDRLTIHGEQGSYAETWAAAHGVPFAAGA